MWAAWLVLIGESLKKGYQNILVSTSYRYGYRSLHKTFPVLFYQTGLLFDYEGEEKRRCVYLRPCVGINSPGDGFVVPTVLGLLDRSYFLFPFSISFHDSTTLQPRHKGQVGAATDWLAWGGAILGQRGFLRSYFARIAMRWERWLSEVCMTAVYSARRR